MSDTNDQDETKATKSDEKKHDNNSPTCACGHCGPSSDLATKMLDTIKAFHEGTTTRSDEDKMTIDLDAASKLLAALVAECNGHVNIIVARLLWRIDIAESKKRERETKLFMEFMKSAQFVGSVSLEQEDEDDEDKKPVTVN
jgi:hypothetical protein